MIKKLKVPVYTGIAAWARKPDYSKPARFVTVDIETDAAPIPAGASLSSAMVNFKKAYASPPPINWKAVLTGVRRNAALPPGHYHAKVSGTAKSAAAPLWKKGTKMSHSLSKPRTQKARGIMACNSFMAPGVAPVDGSFVLPYGYGLDGRDDPKWPQFARPCPMVPRHGFVDSRRVNSWAATLAVLQETHEAEPGGEVVVQPYLKGDYSAIVTEAGITVGHGNSGVTDGTDKFTVHVPCVNTFPLRIMFPGNFWANEQLKDVAHPYLELVTDRKGNVTRIVQWRDGPAQPGGISPDFIPAQMKVEHVLDASGYRSLLEWEAAVSGAKPGTVLHCPKMPLSSHWAVHGIASNMPVLTTREPEIGETLTPNTDREASTMSNGALRALSELIQDAARKRMDDMGLSWQRQGVGLAIGVSHAQAMWGGNADDALLRLRALGMVWLLRASAAACAGELRYYGTCHGPDYRNDRNREAFTDLKMDGSDRRDEIYSKLLTDPHSLAWYDEQLTLAVEDYGADKWNDSGYGGPKWAACSQVGADLAGALFAFTAKPSAEKWNTVIRAANNVVHTSHNGGKCLTKWVGSYDMSRVACAPSLGLVSPMACNIIRRY